MMDVDFIELNMLDVEPYIIICYNILMVCFSYLQKVQEKLRDALFTSDINTASEKEGATSTPFPKKTERYACTVLYFHVHCTLKSVISVVYETPCC